MEENELNQNEDNNSKEGNVENKESAGLSESNNLDNSLGNNEATDAVKDLQSLDVSLVRLSTEKIKEELSKVVVGQSELVEYLLASIFVSGHCLLEGLPGLPRL